VSWFASSTSATQWRKDRTITIDNSEPWLVPADPTWAEDPHDDLSWQRTYHSLKWLQSPMTAYRETGDDTYARDVADYVMSWIRLNPSDDPPVQR
jgi:hypothetical protein